MQSKICTKCGIEKSLSNFTKDNQKKDKHYSSCKECVNLYQSNWYLKNFIKIQKRNKRFYLLNKKKINSYNDNYYLQNKKDIIKQTVKRTAERIKIDINFKLSVRLRNRALCALKGKNKSKRTLELLGCTVEFFRNYLESQFNDGMNWNNYGHKGWVIDHIKPCCSFNLSDPKQQKECFHYTNLQPLWEVENLKKLSLDKQLSLNKKVLID